MRWWWLPVIFGTYLFLVQFRGFELELIWILFTLAAAETVFFHQGPDSLPRAFSALFGAVYLGILPAQIVRIGLDYSQDRILFVLIIMIWIVDSAAYFVGMSLGKHRNIFPVSPRKSLEGFAAGMLVRLLIVFILYVADVNFISPGILLLAAIAAGVVGQLGDLVESVLKRFAGIKDSSRLIPGHGGILDRTDSILLAGSFIYCIISIVNKVR
jgi:phosphatidate cytidylyltransferase